MFINPKLQSRFSALKTSGMLPSPKGVALKVLKLTQQDSTTAAQLARAIEGDAALVARLIKLSNNCQPPGSRPILAIKDAISILGLNAVRGLVLGVSLMADRQAGRCSGFDYTGFWARNLACAVAMRAFSAHARVIQGDEAFTLGLLSHVGELGLAGLFPDEYSPLIAAGNTVDLLAQEHRAFEFDHADLTAALLLDWGFPEGLVSPIIDQEHHATPDQADQSRAARLTLTLMLSSHMADICMADAQARPALLEPLLALGRRLGIDPPDLSELCDEIVHDWLDWSQLLNSASHELPPFAELIASATSRPAQAPGQADQTDASYKPQVLVVTADSQFQSRLAQALEKIGDPFQQAASSEAALHLFHHASPELLLIDCKLPNTTGAALVRSLRKTTAGQVVFLVLLTEPTGDAQVQEVFAAGADDFLPKTVSPAELLGRLMAWQRVVYLRRNLQREQSSLKQFSAEFDRLSQLIEESRTRELENEQRMELALSGSDLGSWDWDIATGHVVLNERWWSMLGLRAKEAAPTMDTWRKLTHPDDVANVESAMKRHLSTKTPVYESEYRLRHRNGHWIWVLDRGRVVSRNSAGEALRVVGTHMDITERKLAQERLQRSNVLLQSILKNIPVGLSAFDAKLNLIAKNELFQTSLDLPNALFEKKPTTFESIVRFNAERGEYGAGDVDSLVADVIARTREAKAHQFERERADGTVLEIRGAPMPGGGFVTTYTDITERKRAAAQVLHSTQLLRGAIDSIDEAFALFDPQDKLFFCNEKYRKLYALSADLIKPGASFEHIIREGVRRGQYPDALGHEEQWVAERLAAHRAADTTLVQRLDNGRALRIIERKLADGSIVGFRVDITDLVRATEEAQAANLAKSRFLATMSHEIRTPMNGILGMAQLLLNPKLGDTERQEYAQTVLNSGRSLLTLLNDILDLSKIEAGRFQLDLTDVDPEQLLLETYSLFSGAAKNKGLQLECHWHGPPGQVYQSDSHRLRQMLSNLVGNAIKFTATGQVRIEATQIECHDATALLEFSVTDTGMGIAADKQNLLFKSFSQADSSTTREFGGSGLGLSIVSRLARLLGGDVGVQSAPGQGSRFWFRVRAATLSTVATAQTSLAEPAPVQLSGRVLVAEDNPVNCMVIEGLLHQLGLDVVVVGDGQQAVDALVTGQHPDVVLMDLHMPVMDGYLATERIRQWESAQQLPRVPIIALTADAFEEVRLRCLAIGMDDFLTKPIAINDLKLALTQWLLPHASVPPASPVPLASEIDWPQFNAQLATVMHLLEQHKFDALDHYDQLQALAGQSSLGNALRDIGQQVKTLHLGQPTDDSV